MVAVLTTLSGSINEFDTGQFCGGKYLQSIYNFLLHILIAFYNLQYQ